MTADHSVHTIADIVRRDGMRSAVIGEYRVVARPTRGDAPSPEDYAVVVLEDGTEVFLETFATPAARRDESERRRFHGRHVRVDATVHRRMPTPGQGPLAPSVSDIRGITEVEPDEGRG